MTTSNEVVMRIRQGKVKEVVQFYQLNGNTWRIYIERKVKGKKIFINWRECGHDFTTYEQACDFVTAKGWELYA
jgi:hypothetical protein